jgi:hypothetical protein
MLSHSASFKFFLVLHLPLGIQIGLFPLRFLTEILRAFLLSVSLFSILPSESFINVVIHYCSLLVRTQNEVTSTAYRNSER